MSDSVMVKKWKIAPYINTGTTSSPVWVRIKKSTTFDLVMNPEVVEYDYIADEAPTSELIRYKPSLSQPVTMYKGEEDYDFVFDSFYELKTGSDAKTEFLLVFYQESTDTYALTTDTAIDSTKTYYTLSDGTYTEVEDPDVDDIATYYELESTTYKAWESECMIAINDLNSVDSTINIDVHLNGTIAKGTVVLTDGDPVFTESE